MNCAATLEALLNAEPSELSGEGSSTVAQHIRSCERCRRLATQLEADTRLLATALPRAISRRRAARRVRYAVVAPVGFVAGMLALTVMQRNQAPVIITQPVLVRPVAVVPRDPPPPPTIQPTTQVRRAPTKAFRAFPAAVPIQPVPLTSSEPATIATSVPVTVSVEPPAGTRAVVMHTTNPKLTVVWIY